MTDPASNLGAHLVQDGVQAALFSRHGTRAWLCSFSGDKETRVELQKSGDVFSGFVRGLKAGALYGFRVAGPWAPQQGHLFDESKLLIDPYATRLTGPFVYDEALSKRGQDSAALLPKCIVEAARPDLALRQVKQPRLIYELGVKSFTKLHPGVPENRRGTVAALAEPAVIAHLKKLGVDTIELMPIHVWIDEHHLLPLGLSNAWGYNNVQFLALDPRLCPGGWNELRSTVATLHENGLHVILDVVFNHTGEAGQSGPTLSFRGLDNASYYEQTDGVLHNDSGTGNMLALNNAPVTAMVMAALRHAVLKAGVDGFRFDLATVLGRMANGFDPQAPLLTAISTDPVLSSRILIAEPWDVGPGGYQLGNFPPHWLEWNDRYRDGVRRFWRGDDWSANQLATRLSGSSDIFAQRKPSASVNFIAAHDGFTLHDLTHYAEKNNAANGEENRDGNASEVTCPGCDPRALLATLFFSRGTLMLTAGDEFGRSQKGNNNAYAQDNELTWLNWAGKDQSLIDFTSSLNALRQKPGAIGEDRFFTEGEASWFAGDGKPLDWASAKNAVLGLRLKMADGADLAFMFNAGATPLPLPLAPEDKRNWHRIFTSGTGTDSDTDCPARSVSVFQLNSTE